MNGRNLLSPQQAEEAISSRLTCSPIESLPLMQCVGAILREDVVAERDLPTFDRVCMDGIAVDSEALGQGLSRFMVQGTQAAGSPALQLEHADNAIEVMTGAILPRAADCIVPVEQYSIENGIVSLTSAAVSTPYRNIQRRAADGAAGMVMLKAGCILGPPEIAVAASAGLARVRVSSQPAFMIVSTGNELVEPGEPIAAQQVRRSNAYAVAATLRARGFGRVGDDHVPDDEGMLRERLTLHLTTHEVVILSGGVSMGKFDFVPKALIELGVEEVFHKVAQRPGKPMWFGIGPQGQAVFGLPGNPGSTMMTFELFARAALELLSGAREAPLNLPLARLTKPFRHKTGLTRFLPAVLSGSSITPVVSQGSGDVAALSRANAFLVADADRAEYSEGDLIQVLLK